MATLPTKSAQQPSSNNNLNLGDTIGSGAETFVLATGAFVFVIKD